AHLEEVYKATTDQLDWVNPEGQQYPHNLLQPLPLIPDNRGRHVIPFDHFINNDLEYLRGATDRLQQARPLGSFSLGQIRQQFYGYAVNRESALDVYSKRRIIAVTELNIVEWHDYKHLDWILVRRDDDQIYKFKEGDFKRLLLQDIEDMLLLLEHCHPEASGRSSTGSGNYQKRLNLTNPDTYRPDLKRRKAYMAHSNPRGFIYQNKDKKNRLMRIDKLHKFNDGTLNDVRNALDDHLKGIRMQYLPTIIWRRGDKDRAAKMIQAIEKMLKTMRILRSLKKFVGGRLFGAPCDVDTATDRLQQARPLGSFSLGQIRQQFYGYAVNRESALDVYSKRRIIAVTELNIVEWHDYKHLDWILDVYQEHCHPEASGRSSTGSGNYQKRLNLTNPDTYRPDLKRRKAYMAHSNPRGFIYQNKDKKNRLMRIDKLHKFNDGTLNDVRNALDDHLKGIRMQYLPTIIWRRGDKDRAAKMIQAIEKMLKTMRILRSLKKFVGGRLYEGDFRMLQRTI
nr:hypothetical protein [Tanacetum cinerariifolium]